MVQQTDAPTHMHTFCWCIARAPQLSTQANTPRSHPSPCTLPNIGLAHPVLQPCRAGVTHLVEHSFSTMAGVIAGLTSNTLAYAHATPSGLSAVNMSLRSDS